MPPVLPVASLMLTFEQVTYILLAASVVVIFSLSLKLYFLHKTALSKIADQDAILSQLAQLTAQNSATSDRSFRHLGEAMQSLSLSTVERLGLNHQELLKTSYDITSASQSTLRTFQAELMDKFNGSSRDMHALVQKFQSELAESQKADFDRLEHKIEAKIDRISRKVVDDFDANLQSSQKAFTDVVERLARIDAAQQKIEALSQNVVSLQDILSDTKARGAFGETQLNHVLSAVFGSQGELYSQQVTLPNGKVADVMMHLPEPIGNMAVDSKFPLANYRRLLDRKLTAQQRKSVVSAFSRDFKKHVDDIASRYILPGFTTNQAILFLPAEAVFAEIYSQHQYLIDYAHSKRVWIVSPTTFLAQLSTIQMVVANLKREKYAHIIQAELSKLAADFERYKERWAKLTSQLGTVSKSVNELNITTDKISKRFDKINHVNL